MQITPINGALGEESPWWALYTRHQHEKTVAGMLSAKGFEVFLPLYDSVRRWKDRRKLLSLPLFPGYVFVRGGLNRRLQIVTTPGVYTILYRGDQVATIPDEEIHAVRKAVDNHFSVEPHPYLKCGERVRVVCGALLGVEGILVRRKNDSRLILSVDMLAQSAGVEIDAAHVEPVVARAVVRSLSASPLEAAQLLPNSMSPGRSVWGVRSGQETAVRA